MKKFLLMAASVALASTSANAADLAARPYTKAPPAIAAVYDWSGFYIGANGGYATSRNCCNFESLPVCRLRPAKAVTMRMVGSWVDKLAIAGRPAPGCSA